MLEARTERPVSEQPAGLFTQHTDRFVIDDDDMDFDTATESNLSLRSRSFLNRINDRCERCWTVLQKMQCKTSTNILQIGECLFIQLWKHLYSWGRITQTICIPSKIVKNLTLKHMFEISEKLILEQSDEIFGVTQISWEN